MNKRRGRLHSLIVLGLFAPTFPSAAVPSFPGAQGGGATSVGGRGGAVIEVTNLNDSGAGSLRACVLASGPRTCVFRVGGTIQVLSEMVIYNPFLTVAGQTAPGGGILLSGKNATPRAMVVIRTHDAIWRYTRIRKGYTSAGDGTNLELGATLMMNGYNLIVDHNSVSWNQDEGIGLNGGTPTYNITISNNLVAEGLSNHATGYIITGNTRPTMTNIDYHRNLTMNENHRNPAGSCKTMRWVNNITYNTKSFNMQIGWPDLSQSTDIKSNIWKKGPLGSPPEVAAYGTQSIYMSGNKGYNQPNPAGDQWVMVRQSLGQNGPLGGATPASWRRTTPLANTTYPITAQPVAGLEASVLPSVGASRRLDCNGNWVAARDSVDNRLVNQYQTNTGNTSLVANESQVGGFPVISGGTPCTDTDRDGMPDGWEAARGLNSQNAADRNATGGSGYTNLELYLAGTGSGTTQSTPPPSPPSPPPPPPTTSLPDVVVTSLSYANGIFTSTVKNQGTAATPSGIAIGVGYFVNSVGRTWGSVWGPLAAGASVTIGTTGGAYKIPTGTQTIKAYVDDVNRFAESDETNNQLSKQITVP